MDNRIKEMLAKTFEDIAKGLETGSFGGNVKIGVTGIGSEHGEANVIAGAVNAVKSGIDVVYIGTETHPLLDCKMADCEDDAHKIMEGLLRDGSIQGAVSMHYPFPIGVSTVGKCIAPSTGRDVYISTTTGTSSTDKVEGMVLNTLYGIISAKACGNENPTVGFLNVEGARTAASLVKKLEQNGYPINFAESKRSDGGYILRGNDILTGAADVIVMDPLTGNVITKMLSSFSSGGSYESLGYGYGPGISENYDSLVMIISRASGAPVIEGAIKYAADLVRGDYRAVAKDEFEKARKAGLDKLLEELKSSKEVVSDKVEAPAKEVVTGQISGVEIMDLEDAVQALWKAGIYAESGMGCTGPIVLVSEARLDESTKALIQAGYLGE